MKPGFTEEELIEVKEPSLSEMKETLSTESEKLRAMQIKRDAHEREVYAQMMNVATLEVLVERMERLV